MGEVVMEYLILEKAEIGHKIDDKYFVYYIQNRCILFNGSYKECLIVIGALSLDNRSTSEAIQLAKEIK